LQYQTLSRSAAAGKAATFFQGIESKLFRSISLKEDLLEFVIFFYITGKAFYYSFTQEKDGRTVFL
jgi:hypothetical protein